MPLTAVAPGLWSYVHTMHAPGGVRMPVRMNLARVGASRDMISRLMKDLVSGGYVAVEDRTIVILKKPPPAW